MCHSEAPSHSSWLPSVLVGWVRWLYMVPRRGFDRPLARRSRAGYSSASHFRLTVGFVNQFFHLLYGTKPEPGPFVDFVIDRIWETDQSVMAERLALLESFDISDRLWRIDSAGADPGRQRDVIVPAIRQQALANGVSAHQFGLIENAGHIGFLTHCDEVVRHVRRHLKRLGAPV